MRLSHWLRPAHPRPVAARPRLRVEPLEDRSVPAAFTVSTLADDGPGSLRAAVAAANANPGPDLIDFAPRVRGTVTLTTGELGITDDVLIAGPGAGRLAVSGNDASRVFNIAGGAAAVIDGLTVTRGGGVARGGGILSAGTLTLSDAVVSDNAVVGQPGNFPPGGLGGGVFSSGTLTVLDTTFARNRAVGKAGEPAAPASAGVGGAIFSLGSAAAPATAVVSGSTFVGNRAVGGAAGTGAAGGNALGGALMNDAGTLTVSRSTFRDNRAVAADGGPFGAGGAIGNAARFGDAALHVSHCALVGNQAVGGAGPAGTTGQGGAISNLLSPAATPGVSATATVTASILIGNRAVGGAGPTGGTGRGGGIANLNGGELTVTDSLLALNQAVGGAGGAGGAGGTGQGGGVFNDTTTAFGTPTLTLRRSLVAVNRAEGGAAVGGTAGAGVGGGLYLAPGGEASADDATAVAFNSASTSDDDLFGTLG